MPLVFAFLGIVFGGVAAAHPDRYGYPTFQGATAADKAACYAAADVVVESKQNEVTFDPWMRDTRVGAEAFDRCMRSKNYR